MMGKKERHFALLINVSLEALAPHDHFYRHLEQTLDLSFVRGFVQGAMTGSSNRERKIAVLQAAAISASLTCVSVRLDLPAWERGMFYE